MLLLAFTNQTDTEKIIPSVEWGHHMKSIVGWVFVGILGISAWALFTQSQASTKYRCEDETGNRAALLINHYRPWVGLWSNSDGNIQFEAPQIGIALYFDDLGGVGSNVTAMVEGPPQQFLMYSYLSDYLMVTVALDPVFKGFCEREA